MDFYSFFSWTLAVTAVVTLLWPLNIPLAALAYKVRLGNQPMPLEPRPFWIRSTFAALGLALASLVAIGLTFALARGAGFPIGPIHLVMVMLYLPVGVWYMFWMFEMEDLLGGLSVFFLYILLGAIPVLIFGWMFGFWRGLAQKAPWLLSLGS